MPPGARRILSAGCAGAWYFDWVEKCYGQVDEHIGIEFFSPKPEGLPANVVCIANTASQMTDVGDCNCDLVFSGQNIEHLWPEDVVGFLTESWRVLRSGGHLVIDSPNRPITAALNWSHPEHTVELSIDEAERLCSLAGFDVTKTAGIWLCRDPRTSRMLPFDINVGDPDWTLAERLICAVDEPMHSFIWWMEAVRSDRVPDEVGLRELMAKIFDAAWLERIQRFQVGVGEVTQRDGGEWLNCGIRTKGAVLYGPYMPLRAGRYRVSFDIRTDSADLAGGPFARCDVLVQSAQDPVAVLDISEADVASGGQVSLEFVLAQMEFGVQFRCSSYGRARFECRRGATLIALS
jgi:SAM-dependent methyltransferase